MSAARRILRGKPKAREREGRKGGERRMKKTTLCWSVVLVVLWWGSGAWGDGGGGGGGGGGDGDGGGDKPGIPPPSPPSPGAPNTTGYPPPPPFVPFTAPPPVPAGPTTAPPPVPAGPSLTTTTTKASAPPPVPAGPTTAPPPVPAAPTTEAASSSSDLRAGAGVPLSIALRLLDPSSRAPVPSARVDLWHCRFDGLYCEPSQAHQSWLRAFQLSDSSGLVTFSTFFPGWYKGRTVHTRVQVRLFNEDGTTSYNESTDLYYDDDITQAIFTSVYPYNDRGDSMRDTYNTNDAHFSKSKMVNLVGNYNDGTGFSASIDLSLTTPLSISTIATSNIGMRIDNEHPTM